MIQSEHMKSCLAAQIRIMLFKGPGSFKIFFFNRRKRWRIKGLSIDTTYTPFLFILHYLFKSKGPWTQSTYIYRAPQCMSPRWNWDSPTPLSASECALPLGPKGGGAHLALCLLCALESDLKTLAIVWKFEILLFEWYQCKSFFLWLYNTFNQSTAPQ